MANADKELEERLREVGGRLGSPPGDVDELLALLDVSSLCFAFSPFPLIFCYKSLLALIVSMG